MKITDPEYVLRLWASSMRPRIRMFQHRPLDGVKPTDDRRWQARCKVESMPNYRKVKRVLMALYVNEAAPTLRELGLVEPFQEALGKELETSPIIVDDHEAVTADFFVSVGQALAMLKGYGTPMGERKLMENLPMITNYKQGRLRMVRWSEVVLYAPRKRIRRLKDLAA